MGAEAITHALAGLAQLSEWIDTHPGLGSHSQLLGTTWIIGVADAEEAADVMRAMADGAHPGDIKKSVHELTLFAERTFTGGVTVQMQAPRDEVCEWVVTGTEVVRVPDPAVVSAAPTVEIEREVGEWQCHPILAGGAR